MGFSRTEIVRFRVSPVEREWLFGEAARRGVSLSGWFREVSGLDGAGLVPVPEVVPVPGDDLAERRERRAKELSVSMPLSNARVLAAREIPE